MTTITLSAVPKGTGFQASVTYPDGGSISSEKIHPTHAEAIAAAARTVLEMPERLAELDKPGADL